MLIRSWCPQSPRDPVPVFPSLLANPVKHAQMPSPRSQSPRSEHSAFSIVPRTDAGPSCVHTPLPETHIARVRYAAVGSPPSAQLPCRAPSAAT